MAYKQSPLTMIQGTAGHKSALKATSPLKQDYVKDRYHPKFNPTGTKGKVVKKVTSGKLKYSDVKKALKTSIKAAGKVAKFVPGLNLVMNLTSKSATATQPGTGGHGGEKIGKYNPETGKYE